jgi:hypothetical protein
MPAVLEIHGPSHRTSKVARRNIQVDADALSPSGRDLGQQLSPSRDLERTQFRRERSGIVHRAPHRAQDMGLGIDAEVTKLSSIVMVGVADSP